MQKKLALLMTIKNNASTVIMTVQTVARIRCLFSIVFCYLTINANNKELKANKRTARSIVDSRIRPDALPAGPI